MCAIDQVIVALWFLPVVFFVILPLLVACFGLLHAVFDVFRPVAGQAGNPPGIAPEEEIRADP